ncbi:cyclin-T1-4-like isoform X2 [Wolffia australiana]
MSSRVHSIRSQRRPDGGFRSDCANGWIGDASDFIFFNSCAHDVAAVDYRQGLFFGGQDVSFAPPPLKRRAVREKPFDGGAQIWNPSSAICGDGPSTSNSFLGIAPASLMTARDDPDARFVVPELDDVVLMSRDELERCSPSRKDGINLLRETHLRYSYCAFIKNLGLRLNLPQTTVGTAMVLCHRFFARRSHACHDRFLIATAALFLAAKSEETPCPLNTVVGVAWEMHERHNPPLARFSFSSDWFDQYRESVVAAEHVLLTTLNFELDVKHPYTPLKSVLQKLGLSQSILLNLALNLINEGILKRVLCSPISYS